MPWYTQSARTWDEALPIGNGRLGAMVHGRTSIELLQLNENSVWYGGKQDRTPYGASEHLEELRSLVRKGKHDEAEALVEDRFFAIPSSMRHYEPLSTVKIEFGHVEEQCERYRRSLDLQRAVTRTEYELGGVTYEREMIASWSHEIIALKIAASRSSRIVVRLSRLTHIEYETNEYYDAISEQGGKLVMTFTPGGKGSNRGCCVVGATTFDGEGTVEVINKSLIINAKKALIVFSGHTIFRKPDPESAALKDVEAALQLDPETLWQEHVETYQSLFNRVHVSVGDNMSPDDPSFGPTDQRIKSAPTEKLVQLYHDYGRYLLISSSRVSSQHMPSLPANLQGIWSNNFSPAWGCKFTININIQMNYWGTNIWNLSSCEDPLYEHLGRMVKRGEKTAREVYGFRGWCAHNNTDIWADTDPEARWMPGTLWPLGGAWLCLHIWERWLYTNDTEFLKKTFYMLEGAVQFCKDLLIESKEKKFLVPFPSLSPENCFWADDSRTVKGHLCEGSAIDVQIIHALFQAYISACSVLQLTNSTTSSFPSVTSTAELFSAVKSVIPRLPPHKISPSHGHLQEYAEDYSEPEPGHRHFSHLFVLFPGNTITPASTPELADACRKTLLRRLEHGGAHTGWSRAWLINLYARLGDGEECLRHLTLLLQKSTLPNLLDNHPPFQIDGNFGGAAGVLEMLLQSHEVEYDKTRNVERRVVRLLPACPLSWMEKGGQFRGLKGRGGLEVTCAWERGSITECTVTNQFGCEAVVVLPNGERILINGIGKQKVI